MPHARHASWTHARAAWGFVRAGVRGFMAREHPLGFAPGGDFGAVGYEPPPPGEPRGAWSVPLLHGGGGGGGGGR